MLRLNLFARFARRVACASRPVFSAGLNFGGVPLTPGATVSVSVPLSAQEKRTSRRGEHGPTLHSRSAGGAARFRPEEILAGSRLLLLQ